MSQSHESTHRPSWAVLLRRFGVLGLTGFGGPPAHLAALRRTWVDSGDVSRAEFDDAIASASLAPGPTSTQVAMWVGWRQRGARGAVAAALLFISPAVVLMTVMAVGLHNNSTWGDWIVRAAIGASWVMPGVIVSASWQLVPEAIRSKNSKRGTETAWFTLWVLLAVAVEQFRWANPVIVVMVAGTVMYLRGAGRSSSHTAMASGVTSVATTSLAGLALKVGLFSVGGGFVVVPIMRADAVATHHWMSEQIFVAVVALGQLTPGPVFSTIAAIGYFADGIRGALVASVLTFLPSLLFVIAVAPRIERWRQNPGVQRFFSGALPASLGLIAGTTPFFVAAIHQPVGYVVAAVGGVVVLSRRIPVAVLLGLSGVLGLLVATP